MPVNLNFGFPVQDARIHKSLRKFFSLVAGSTMQWKLNLLNFFMLNRNNDELWPELGFESHVWVASRKHMIMKEKCFSLPGWNSMTPRRTHPYTPPPHTLTASLKPPGEIWGSVTYLRTLWYMGRHGRNWICDLSIRSWPLYLCITATPHNSRIPTDSQINLVQLFQK